MDKLSWDSPYSANYMVVLDLPAAKYYPPNRGG
jgi:hypothetical protein